MFIYRKSFLPYTDDNAGRSAVLFQMIERFLIHKKKRVAAINNGHECTRTVRYFHLQDSIDLAEERVATMTNQKWLVNWHDLLSILNKIRDNYIEPYNADPRKQVIIELTEDEIHSRGVKAAKSRICREFRRDIFRIKWNSLVW